MKEVKIKLDDKSLEILKEIDTIHRESIINFGLRLASQTEYFKILKGEINIEIEEVSNISSETKTESKPEPVKEDTGIDLSDLGGF